MIRLAFMTDPALRVGSSDPQENAVRFSQLPRALNEVMGALYTTRDAVIAGAPSLVGLQAPGFQGKTRYCLSRSLTEMPIEALADIEIVSDLAPLLDRYRDGPEELVAIGGYTVLNLLLPYAKHLDIAETTETFPGDLVFDAWTDGSFTELTSTPWDGGRTLTLERAPTPG